MQKVEINNLELFYDCLDESNNLLYEVFHKPYFELLEMTVKNILAGEILIMVLAGLIASLLNPESINLFCQNTLGGILPSSWIYNIGLFLGSLCTVKPSFIVSMQK